MMIFQTINQLNFYQIKKLTVALTIYTNFDKKNWKESAINEAAIINK